MKIKSLLASLVIGAGLTASSLFANSVTLTSTGYVGVPNANGGEFVATTSDNGTFLTFCLEESVSVTLNAGYSYTIDNVVLAQNDKISQGTAWLYEAFRKGTLAGYAPDALTHNVNAGLLQQALWSLEDENSVSNYYTNLAATHFGSLALAKADYTGNAVKVLNLWSTQVDPETHKTVTVDIQSQLFLVPDGGVTTALLGLGLLSLALFRRKL